MLQLIVLMIIELLLIVLMLPMTKAAHLIIIIACRLLQARITLLVLVLLVSCSVFDVNVGAVDAIFCIPLSVVPSVDMDMAIEIQNFQALRIDSRFNIMN
jgi:hypothetical protein